MRLRLAAAVGCAALCAGAAPAIAQAPPTLPDPYDQVRILAVFDPMPFGRTAFITGQFRHLDPNGGRSQPYGGHTVTLEESPYPYIGYTPVATTVTDPDGFYAFERRPLLNTRYHVTASNPPATSDYVNERVMVRLRLRVTRAGGSFRFAGTATPAHDGRTVFIQKQSKSGKYRNAARARLRPNGGRNSKFQLTMKVSKRGVYRAFLPKDRDHFGGTSSAVAVG